MTGGEAREFQHGDRVRIINRKSYRASHEGTITATWGDDLYPGVVVEFTPGDSCLYGPSALQLVAAGAASCPDQPDTRPQ